MKREAKLKEIRNRSIHLIRRLENKRRNHQTEKSRRHEADSSSTLKELKTIVKPTKQDSLALEIQVNTANSEKKTFISASKSKST